MRNAKGMKIIRPFMFKGELAQMKPFWIHLTRDQYNNIDLDLHINPTGIVNWILGRYKDE